jgi:F-type H+-transporting ATPase subunit b
MQLYKYITAVYPMIFTAAALASEAAEQASEHSGESSVFSGYPGESIWTLVWFAVLLIALRKFAWKPLLAGLKAREDHISSEISGAEETRKKANEKLAEYERRIAEASEEARRLAEKEIAKGQDKAGDIVNAAKKEAEGIKNRAKDDINKAAESARKKLWDDAGEMVCSLGSEIFARTITPEDNKKLIDEAINKFRNVQNTA